jgi:Tfp pilus assembly PilM family ATPase
MGSWNLLNKRSTPPIAIHFGGDVIRMMQIQRSNEPTLHYAVEVSGTGHGIEAAMEGFLGKQCIVGLPSGDLLVQHVRVPIEASEKEIREQLIPHDSRWGNAEIRNLCVMITGSGSQGNARQELICLGIDRNVMLQCVDDLEKSKLQIVAITAPIYASIRVFDQLYRRTENANRTSMLIEIEDKASMVMIAQGGNCVFANQFDTRSNSKSKSWEPIPSLIKVSAASEHGDERRGTMQPRGLREVDKNNGKANDQLVVELERCLRHHDALFPDRVVDQIIFSGHGANDTEICASIATKLGIAGYIADPSAWIAESAEVAGGPAWTTVAGMCLRYTEMAA